MDSTKYINNTTYISVKTVEAMPADQRLFTITGEGHEHTFKPEEGPKLVLPIMNVKNLKEYEWTLGYKAIQDLTNEFNSGDTKEWMKKPIKLLLVPTAKGSHTVTATII